MNNRISRDEIKSLSQNPSEENRKNIVEKIAQDFDKSILSPEERHIAEDIFRLILKDAAEVVRASLAENLKSSDDLPRDIALSLAEDIDIVAGPILTYSKVLKDSDLIAIIQGNSEEKQKFIAKRENISEEISEELVNTNNKAVIQTLVENKTADISSQSYKRIIKNFKNDSTIQKQIVERDTLPADVIQNLIEVVSSSLQDKIISKHNVSSEIAEKLVRQTSERALINLSEFTSAKESSKLARDLAAKNKITTSLLLRAVCMGRMGFLAHCLSEVCQIPFKNVQILLDDHDGLGFESLYQKARLPRELFKYFQLALKVYKETLEEGIEESQTHFTSLVIERILTKVSITTGLSASNIEYLLSQLDNLKESEHTEQVS